MNRKSLKVHPKYGRKRTKAVCFFCGEDTGEIVLLGAEYKGEAPMRMIVNYEPCAKCKEKMAQGITFIEAERDQHGKPLPTGRWAILSEEGVTKVIEDCPERAKALEKRRAYVSPAAFDKLLAEESPELH